MSCIRCDEAQGEYDDDHVLQTFTFVRVGSGNIMVVGCEMHLKKLINKLKEEKEDDKQT